MLALQHLLQSFLGWLPVEIPTEMPSDMVSLSTMLLPRRGQWWIPSWPWQGRHFCLSAPTAAHTGPSGHFFHPERNSRHTLFWCTHLGLCAVSLQVTKQTSTLATMHWQPHLFKASPHCSPPKLFCSVVKRWKGGQPWGPNKHRENTRLLFPSSLIASIPVSFAQGSLHLSHLPGQYQHGSAGQATSSHFHNCTHYG